MCCQGDGDQAYDFVQQHGFEFLIQPALLSSHSQGVRNADSPPIPHDAACPTDARPAARLARLDQSASPSSNAPPTTYTATAIDAGEHHHVGS
jgi:hypothetical protein